MAQHSHERRFRFFLKPPPRCPLCESSRVTCIGQVEEIGFFRCEGCDGVFTIQFTAPASEVAHDAHIAP